MRISIFIIILGCFISCEKVNHSQEVIEDKPTIAMKDRVNYNDRITAESLSSNKKWTGIEMKSIEDTPSFCTLFHSIEHQVKSISKTKCKDTENTEITFLSGSLIYSINDKDFGMIIYVFLPDSGVIKEIPTSGNMDASLKLTEMENKEVKAYLSEDMLCIYLNPEVKIILANYCTTPTADYRDGATTSQVELLEIGNLLIEELAK